jgi:hypothetical protein
MLGGSPGPEKNPLLLRRHVVAGTQSVGSSSAQSIPSSFWIRSRGTPFVSGIT